MLIFSKRNISETFRLISLVLGQITGFKHKFGRPICLVSSPLDYGAYFNPAKSKANQPIVKNKKSFASISKVTKPDI